MQDMIRREFLPALMTYTDQISRSVSSKTAVLTDLSCAAEKKLLSKLSGYYESIYSAEEKLEADTAAAEGMEHMPAAASFYHETVLADMEALRSIVDTAEEYLPDSILPYPNYEKLLFSV